MRRKLLLLGTITYTFLAISCNKNSDEILALLQEIKQQNSDLRAQVTSLQKTTDSLSAALKLTNQNIAGMDRKIDSIRNQLTSIVTQINSLSAQLNQANTNIADIQKRIAELQAKCQELVDQLNILTGKINITNGLISYYPFNGNAGDSSILSYHGIVFNAKFIQDRFGNISKAINFTIPNIEYVKTNGLINDVINTFTISFWVNPLSDDKIISEGITGREGYGSQTILHPTHGGSWGIANQNAGVGVYVGKNQISVVEHTDNYISAPLVFSGNLTGWHLVTLVYDNHLPKLYVDGSLVKSGKVSNILNVRPSNGNDNNNGYGNYSTSGIGRSFSPSGENAQFNGSIDELRIYNRILTQAEITYLANN